MLNRLYGPSTNAICPHFGFGPMWMPVPMEPRSTIGEWDDFNGRYVLYASTQGSHGLRRTLTMGPFPGHEGEMTAFGFVQHNFFIFFNAAIGLLFLRRANREIFGAGAAEPA